MVDLIELVKLAKLTVLDAELQFVNLLGAIYFSAFLKVFFYFCEISNKD